MSLHNVQKRTARLGTTANATTTKQDKEPLFYDRNSGGRLRTTLKEVGCVRLLFINKTK